LADRVKKRNSDPRFAGGETASPETPELYEFGAFRLEPKERKLLRGKEVIVLTPRAFDTLVLLVRNSGHLLEKDELIRALWPDSFVEEGNLTNNISLLRKALGEVPQYIETVPKRGYRFAGAVRQLPNTEGLPLSTSRIVVPAAALFLASLVAGGLYYHSRPLKKLTDKDTIVLADFSNTTGDPVFDGTLRQAMAVQLQPFLNLVSEQKIQQTLPLMGQPGDAKLTPVLARELCQRTGSAAVLEGSIANLGSQYVLGFKAVNCRTGATLTEQQVRAASKEQFLAATDKAAAALRHSLGESLSTVEKFSTPLEQTTTPSLEALQAYTRAAEKDRQGGTVPSIPPSIPFYKRALQLDPNFAMAYIGLGYAYSNILEPGLAAENFKKAYDLRDRVSEREKLTIESAYYWNVDGDLGKTLQVLQVLEETYPGDMWAPNDLAIVYKQLGDYEKALGEAKEAARRDPGSRVNYLILAPIYLNLNRYEEAMKTAEEGHAKDPDNVALRMVLYQLAFLRNDSMGMANQVAWATGKPGAEDTFLSFEAFTAAYFGRLRKARDFWRRAVLLTDSLGKKDLAAAYECTAAVIEGLLGNSGQARRQAETALKISPHRNVQFQAALAFAFAGETLRPQALADDLFKHFPFDTIVQSSFLPRIRAQVALNQKKARGAVEILQAVAPYELGIGVGLPVYLRGEAYLAADQPTEAAAQFQKLLEHRGIVANAPVGSLAHLGLGRAYALSGDTAKAKAAYQDFLTLWKDADPDIPILKQAKAEYAKLQ
jgi:DNA-binding winged helix-turn-helix (wHTH) protein/predicted Zn-dependent protease